VLVNVGPNPNEQCPACGVQMAADQRYCLSCGSRRGDPRLPFMDAVVFMEAINQPRTAAGPPAAAPQRRPRLSPNASLIAGVATLVLAIGVGVLIGRSGDESQPTAAATPQVITVAPEGGGSTAPSKKNTASENDGKKNSSASKADKAASSEEAEKVIKSEVPIAPPTTHVGDTCDKETAGCGGNGKFDGSFFGE